MKFYGASKIWHAPLWQSVRDLGNTARWIDIEGDSESTPVYQGEEITRQDIWNFCLTDVTKAQAVILYCGAMEENQRGAVMEAGHAMGQGKPVYCINTCETLKACPTSDVAFTHHELWNWVAANEWLSFEEGFRRAYWKAQNDILLAEEQNVILHRFAAKRSA